MWEDMSGAIVIRGVVIDGPFFLASAASGDTSGEGRAECGGGARERRFCSRRLSAGGAEAAYGPGDALQEAEGSKLAGDASCSSGSTKRARLQNLKGIPMPASNNKQTCPDGPAGPYTSTDMFGAPSFGELCLTGP